MGGALRYRKKMKCKKKHKKGNQVNDPLTCRRKRKLKPSFHSIQKDPKDFKSHIVEIPAWYLALLLR